MLFTEPVPWLAVLYLTWISPNFTSSKLPSLPVVPVIASVSFANALASSYCAYLILFGILEQASSTPSTW